MLAQIRETLSRTSLENYFSRNCQQVLSQGILGVPGIEANKWVPARIRNFFQKQNLIFIIPTANKKQEKWVLVCQPTLPLFSVLWLSVISSCLFYLTNIWAAFAYGHTTLASCLSRRREEVCAIFSNFASATKCDWKIIFFYFERDQVSRNIIASMINITATKLAKYLSYFYNHSMFAIFKQDWYLIGFMTAAAGLKLLGNCNEKILQTGKQMFSVHTRSWMLLFHILEVKKSILLVVKKCSSSWETNV